MRLKWIIAGALIALPVMLGSTLVHGGREPGWEVVPEPATLPDADGSGMAHVNGQDIYYEIHGTTGPWIVFLHGGMGSALAWGSQVPSFAAHNRMLLIESRGHGRSSWDGAPITYQAMASDVLGVMDTLHIEKADVVGWSDGGIIGLVLGIDHPERVIKIVALGANSDPDGLEVSMSPEPKGDRDVADDAADVSPTADAADAFSAAIYTMWANEPHITEDLGRITVPVLVMAGDHDAIRPDHTRMIANSIPDAVLEIVPNTSHFVIWQKPKVFNTAVKAFLGVE